MFVLVQYFESVREMPGNLKMELKSSLKRYKKAWTGYHTCIQCILEYCEDVLSLMSLGWLEHLCNGYPMLGNTTL